MLSYAEPYVSRRGPLEGRTYLVCDWCELASSNRALRKHTGLTLGSIFLYISFDTDIRMYIHVNNQRVRTSIRIYPRPLAIYLDIHTDIRADVRVELSVLRTSRPGLGERNIICLYSLFLVKHIRYKETYEETRHDSSMYSDGVCVRIGNSYYLHTFDV